jgi:hypothetical protein
MTDNLPQYRVEVSKRGFIQGDGAPIAALDDRDAIEQARATAEHMGPGTSFQVYRPDGQLLREYSR